MYASINYTRDWKWSILYYFPVPVHADTTKMKMYLETKWEEKRLHSSIVFAKYLKVYFLLLLVSWYHITVESRVRLKVRALKHGIDLNTWQRLSPCLFLVFVMKSCDELLFLSLYTLLMKQTKKTRQKIIIMLTSFFLDVFYIHFLIKGSSLEEIVLFFLLHWPWH